MRIEERRHGAVLIVRPDGPVAGDDADAFTGAVLTQISAQAGRLVIDASAIGFIDSRGLEALVSLGERVSATGRTLKLSGLNETVREVLELTETADLFEYYETPDAAARSLA